MIYNAFNKENINDKTNQVNLLSHSLKNNGLLFENIIKKP